MNKPINVAVIGSGYWGKNYVRLLSQFPDAVLAAICDQSQDRLQEAAKLNPNVRLFTSLDDLIADGQFDAAVVCTNPSSHYEVTSRLLENGKHVLVEKPITTLSADAHALSKMAAAKDLVLMVGHIFLFNAGIQEVKKYMDSGSLGEIYYLYARRTNLGPIRSDVNVVWDLAPHDISIFNYFMNSVPEWVSAVGTTFLRSCCTDAAFVVLNYPNGKVANIHVSWADPHKVREVVVIGSEQRVVFNDIVPQQKVTIYKKGIAASSLPYLSYMDYQFSLRDGDIVSPMLNPSEPLKNQVAHFINCIDQGTQPICDATGGENVIKVLEAIDVSIKQNGAPVKV